MEKINKEEMFTVSSKKRTRVQCINQTCCRKHQIKVGMDVNYGGRTEKKSLKHYFKTKTKNNETN